MDSKRERKKLMQKPDVLVNLKMYNLQNHFKTVQD